ncbi:MAG: hypothetical protein JXR49_06275 [Acidobacteria bacterium]|nr:hypothetical protein [Acidobacteriota bacterium]
MVAADSKAKYRNEAEKYMLQGKIKQAIGEYAKIIQNNPDDVLTLNTMGDLYLTIGNTAEANNCFVKVADNYVRNNFFLKAIAVYKKILNADPGNLEINATIASLYAQQGLNTDACNQYLRLAKLFEQSGDTREILNTYRKIVELDPANAAIQKKLAEAYLAGEDKEKGREHLLSAARAMVKTGDPAEAMHCFEQADRINPLDIDGMKDFLECCLRTDSVSTILDRLKELLEADPDNLDIKEMLGRAHLAVNEPEAAADRLQTVVSTDESRYDALIPVVEAFIGLEKYDQAAECLASIIPILITHRETDLATKHLNRILEHRPTHLLALEKLAFVHSSAGDAAHHQEILDKIIDLQVEQQDTIRALENLEKLLQLDPESRKHLDLHKKLFEEANPDTPYVSPVTPTEAPIEAGPGPVQDLKDDAEPTDNTPETIVEADLLINYGMKKKALGLLQNLEARDPYDKQVRTRLLTLLKEDKKFTEAAEQCLLLAVLYGKSNDEDSVENYMAEAKQLDSDMVDREKNLETFARKRGIILEPESGAGLRSDPEIDGDLLDIFFTGEQGGIPEDVSDIPTIPDEIPEGYPEGLAPASPTQSIEEKLQEVDFYIRLGFNVEALNKLNEIAKISPDNPELPPRYEKLNELEASEGQKPAGTAAGEEQSPAESPGAESSEDTDKFQELDIDEALEGFTGSWEETPEQLADLTEMDLPADAGEADETAAAEFADLQQNAPASDPSGFAILEQQDDAVEFDLPDDLETTIETSDEDTVDPQQNAPAADASDFAMLEEQPDDTVEFDLPNDLDTPAESVPQPQNSQDAASASDYPDFIVNDMFSDLLEEVSAINEKEIAKESFEDHFSLGTAYRDMDLIEEAIKEFQTALRITESSKNRKKQIQCCGMLSTCFLKKGMPRSALRWCQTGLNVAGITPQETMAFRYDMGIAHSMEKNQELALQCFDHIFSIDPGYRDVAQQIDKIKGSQI